MISNHISKSVEDFYNTYADSFASSRSKPWQGWQQLKVQLDKLYDTGIIKGKKKFLDLGCGNARFAEFCLNTGSGEGKVKYTGVDISQNLLNYAGEKLKTLAKLQAQTGGCSFNFQLLRTDLTSPTGIDKIKLNVKNVDMVVLMAVMHHIPTQAHRTRILELCREISSKSACIVFTTWQIDQSPKFQRLVKERLADNDYMLHWGSEQTVAKPRYRYVHIFSKKEVMDLIGRAKLNLISDFEADGQDGKLNHYYICTHG